MSSDPNGPRIQGGRCGSVHGDSSFHGCAGIPSGDPPEPPEGKDPIANLDTKFFRIQSSTLATSEGSDDHVPQVPKPTPPGDWLLPGETAENVFKIKHLKGVQINTLPNDATSCREWRAAFLAAVSRIDLTDRDVLGKLCVHCMDGGCGRMSREDLQASSAFSMFNKHVAAELMKPEVLATNTDLAHELTSWVEECATKREGPKGMPLMNLIINYYETGTFFIGSSLPDPLVVSLAEWQIAQGGWGLREDRPAPTRGYGIK